MVLRESKQLTRDEESKPEELFRLAMIGPTVDELRENDCGSGAGREEDVRGTQRAAHGAAQQVKSKGRRPLVLSGYVHEKPFYLYTDGIRQQRRAKWAELRLRQEDHVPCGKRRAA